MRSCPALSPRAVFLKLMTSAPPNRAAWAMVNPFLSTLLIVCADTILLRQGNLGRVGYGGTLEGVWPYVYTFSLARQTFH